MKLFIKTVAWATGVVFLLLIISAIIGDGMEDPVIEENFTNTQVTKSNSIPPSKTQGDIIHEKFKQKYHEIDLRDKKTIIKILKENKIAFTKIKGGHLRSHNDNTEWVQYYITYSGSTKISKKILFNLINVFVNKNDQGLYSYELQCKSNNILRFSDVQYDKTFGIQYIYEEIDYKPRYTYTPKGNINKTYDGIKYEIVKTEDISHGVASRIEIVTLAEPGLNKNELTSIILDVTNEFSKSNDIVRLIILPNKIIPNSLLDTLQQLGGNDYYHALAKSDYTHPSKSDWKMNFQTDTIINGIRVNWEGEILYHYGG